MVIFQSAMLVYQRVPIDWGMNFHKSPPKNDVSTRASPFGSMVDNLMVVQFGSSLFESHHYDPRVPSGKQTWLLKMAMK